MRPFQQAEITFEIEYPAEEPKLEVINETLNTIVAKSRNTTSSDSEIENVSLKLKEDHTSANVQQDVYKVIGLEDAINAPVASMPIRERATDQVDRASIAEKQMERVERIKQVSVNIKNPAAVKSLEEEPAYMRKKIALDAAPSSNHNPVSRFGMTEIQDENGEKRYELKSNNPFLHDNVD